jgi:hypothetical protein
MKAELLFEIIVFLFGDVGPDIIVVGVWGWN